jgi:hypothetical protein
MPPDLPPWDLPQDLLYEPDHLGAFVLVTVILGGAAAWFTGRAIALTWRPWWQLMVYSLILAAAQRFFHFALFDGTLLSSYYYTVDGLVTLAFSFAGFHTTRVRQMKRQYGALLHEERVVSSATPTP